MQRRTCLRVGGVGALAGLAGCLDALDAIGLGASSETILDEPSESRGDPIHPIHGDELPAFSVPDGITGETVTNEDFLDERAQLYTFVFTNCPDGACPALLQRLVSASHTAVDEGYEDDVAFVPITFDPERDTPEVLEAYTDAFGIDPTHPGWHFLRPETESAAAQLVNDDFGLPIERVDPDEVDHDHGDDDHHGDDGEDDHHDDSGDDHHDHGDDGDDEDDQSEDAANGEDDGDDDPIEPPDPDEIEYTFTHFNLILLVNERGIVERSYPQATTVSQREIEADMLTVLEG